jgi:hypothetical protein
MLEKDIENLLAKYPDKLFSDECEFTSGFSG